ncbi:MAG: hypothetical protein DMD81_16295 [Candidatus Rokuibacteriota bacterium]|nr:MAG: hypothetical protein DMD81_16295 [Candidatus Rokubacteria bacterium]
MARSPPPSGESSAPSVHQTTASVSGSAPSTRSPCGPFVRKSPLPHASSGLPSPVMVPITRAASVFVAGESGGSSSPSSAAWSRISSAWPPEFVISASRRPAGHRSPWQHASTSAISSRSSTSIARCARRTAENTLASPARPPVCVVIARRVRSARPTFSTTTGLPRSAARSSAATKRSGWRTLSRNIAITRVRGSSIRYSRKSTAASTASLPDEIT